MGDVVRHVAQIGTKAHHRRLVTDQLRARHGALDQPLVANVASDVLHVTVRTAEIENDGLETSVDSSVDHVRSDEARPAGDQDPDHGRTS
jgi:hypothetical protein